MVSTSRNLSLTGSKFGLGQFMNMEEKDQGETGRTRSRSPFTWWLSNIQDRSQSRQSEMSHQPQMDEVQSRYYPKPEPAFTNRHTHKESAASDYSLPSIINGRELAEDARVDPLQASMSSGSPHSSRYINFSRAFSPLHQSALTPTLAPNGLSQIVESSPRHSSVSKHPSVISTREVVAGDVSASTSQPALALRPLHTSRSVPDHLLRRSSGQDTTSRFSFATETSLSLPTVDLSRADSVPYISHLPASPRSGPLPHRRAYLDESMPGQSGVRSVSLKQPSSETLHEVDSRQSGSAKDPSSNSRSMAYTESRPDLHPARKLSKKGNVLRKKSIRRAEIVSWVGN